MTGGASVVTTEVETLVTVAVDAAPPLIFEVQSGPSVHSQKGVPLK